LSRRFVLAPALTLSLLLPARPSEGRAPDPGEPIPKTDVLPSARPSVVKRGLSAWESDEDTFFATVASDIGFIYLRPRVTLGYGSPYWKFVGIDTYFLATNSFVSPYVGWRASFPFLDALMGVRYVHAFDRRILPRQEEYVADSCLFRSPECRNDLALEPGDTRSTYTAIDFELVLVAPLFHGGVFATAHPVWVDAPSHVRIYEEVLRVVMDPPFALGLRAGYVYGFGESQDVKAGFLIEHIIMPGRPANVVRAGPALLIGLSKHFDFLFAFSPVLTSPDSLGIFHGTYAYLGFLHRFSHRF
jgi:hypothetical protein